jgi:hypothetical protein
MNERSGDLGSAYEAKYTKAEIVAMVDGFLAPERVRELYAQPLGGDGNTSAADKSIKTPTLRPCVLHNTFMGGFIHAVLYDGKVYVPSHKECNEYGEIPLETVGDLFLYDLSEAPWACDCGDFMQLEMDGKWGYCDLRTQEIAIEPQWDYAGYMGDVDYYNANVVNGQLVFSLGEYGYQYPEGGKWGVINEKGEVVKPIEDDHTQEVCWLNSEYPKESDCRSVYRLIERDGKWGVIRASYDITYDHCEAAEIAIPLEWNGIQYYDIGRRYGDIDVESYEFWIGYKSTINGDTKNLSNEKATTFSNYEYTVMSLDGETIITGLSSYPERYWAESAFHLISKNGKYGLVGPTDNGNSKSFGVVIEPTIEKSEAEAIMLLKTAKSTSISKSVERYLKGTAIKELILSCDISVKDGMRIRKALRNFLRKAILKYPRETMPKFTELFDCKNVAYLIAIDSAYQFVIPNRLADYELKTLIGFYTDKYTKEVEIYAKDKAFRTLILSYGISDEANERIRKALPKGAELFICDSVTDLIAINSAYQFVNPEKMTSDELETLLGFYVEANKN